LEPHFWPAGLAHGQSAASTGSSTRLCTIPFTSQWCL
jgi:hypothetical protein